MRNGGSAIVPVPAVADEHYREESDYTDAGDDKNECNVLQHIISALRVRGPRRAYTIDDVVSIARAFADRVDPIETKPPVGI
jgi:hypothetical protein